MAVRENPVPRDYLVTRPLGPRRGSHARSGQGPKKPKRVTRLFFGVFSRSGPVSTAWVTSGPRAVLPRGASGSGLRS